MQVQGCTLFDNEKYALSIGFRTNSLLVETRVKSTLYTPILYWSGARHWVVQGSDSATNCPPMSAVPRYLVGYGHSGAMLQLRWPQQS
jgi:hypothetical protein